MPINPLSDSRMIDSIGCQRSGPSSGLPSAAIVSVRAQVAIAPFVKFSQGAVIRAPARLYRNVETAQRIAAAVAAASPAASRPRPATSLLICGKAAA